MALSKAYAYIVLSMLLTGHVFSYPQPLSERQPPLATPPPTKDGSPRPACEHMRDCYPWVLNECQESRDSGLYIKAYCYDNYCYGICPPVLPGMSPNTTTLQPLDHIRAADTVTVAYSLPTATDVLTTGIGDGEEGSRRRTSSSSPTTYPQLKLIDAKSETMTTITKSDSLTATVPLPVPLPTILPPPDDAGNGDKYGVWRDPASSIT